LRREGHEFEDRSFHFRLDNDVYLYGVFDGHSGSKVSAFAAQKMPAELLLGQLHGRDTDEEIIDVLYQAFMAVEKGFFERINDSLAEKYSLMMQIPEGVTAEQFPHRCPDICKRLKAVDAEIAGGTAALVSLIYDDKLYVANVGCCRALLCTQTPDGHLRVTQLTHDHNLDNTDELRRLALTGIDTEKIRQTGKLAGHFYTRSIGDYHIKNDYKDIEHISSATSSPLLAVPQVYGGFPLDSSCCFLALMSDGLYRTVQDTVGVTADHPVNAEIASIIAAQFASQSTYHGVAQAAVDHVVRQHYTAFESMTDARERSLHRTHDDITLIVRGINFTLASPVVSPASSAHVAQRTPAPPAAGPTLAPLSIMIPLPGPSQDEDSPPRPFFAQSFYKRPAPSAGPAIPTGMPIAAPPGGSDEGAGSSESESSYDVENQSIEATVRAAAALKLDESGRIAPYVDFRDLEAALAALSPAERAGLEAELEPRHDFETILEERESPYINTSMGPLSFMH
jgi:TAK1-binding protein 1